LRNTAAISLLLWRVSKSRQGPSAILKFFNESIETIQPYIDAHGEEGAENFFYSKNQTYYENRRPI
jgi:hypothetical protein